MFEVKVAAGLESSSVLALQMAALSLCLPWPFLCVQAFLVSLYVSVSFSYKDTTQCIRTDPDGLMLPNHLLKVPVSK